MAPSWATSEADSDQLRALLTAPGRDKYPARRSYSYLLSGIFAGGRCGTPDDWPTARRAPPLHLLQGSQPAGLRSDHCSLTWPRPRPATGSWPCWSSLRGCLSSCWPSTSPQAADPTGEDPATVLRKIDERRNELAAAWGAEEISRKEWATAKRVLDERAAKISSRINRSALAQFAALEGHVATVGAPVHDQLRVPRPHPGLRYPHHHPTRPPRQPLGPRPHPARLNA